jgi:flagellar biosynthesis GTPase FlhF
MWPSSSQRPRSSSIDDSRALPDRVRSLRSCRNNRLSQDSYNPDDLSLTQVVSSGDFSLEKSESEVNRLKKDSDLQLANVIVVIMGPTGAGKSRLIKDATGQDVGVSDTLASGGLVISML